MTIDQFIDECERTTSTGKVRLMPEQRAAYYHKLQQFSGEQLSAIYGKVLELTEHFPRVKNCYDAARELGFLSDAEKQYKPHVWEPTDCRLCGGEGLILAAWSRSWEKHEAGIYEVLRLETIEPYSKRPSSRLPADQCGFVFRCKCLAGDAETVQKGIPRWEANIDPIRRRLMVR